MYGTKTINFFREYKGHTFSPRKHRREYFLRDPYDLPLPNKLVEFARLRLECIASGCNNNVQLIFAGANREKRKIFRNGVPHFAKMKNGRHNSRRGGEGEKKIMVYNSNGAKSSYEVCTAVKYIAA